jgi:hypothetical protein
VDSFFEAEYFLYSLGEVVNGIEPKYDTVGETFLNVAIA